MNTGGYPPIGSVQKSSVIPEKRISNLGPVRLAETWLNWLKNTVLAELLREKNTVPAKKNKQNSADYKVNRTGLK